jgi:ubiquitin-conjugating enzyme E2 N
LPLSAMFLEKFASGEEEKERSLASKRAAKAVLKRFAVEPLAGVSITASPEDEYEFHVRLTGPTGSPYESGTFLVSIKLPVEYPNVAPVLSFVTPIEHCNISDGVPCPGLLGLSSDRWSPKMTVHSVLQQLRDDLLNNQSKGDALRPELAAMDDADFFTLAKEATAKHATASQEFPPAPPKKKIEEKQVWAHDYLIIRGEFENSSGDPAELPRIKLKYKQETKPGAATAAAAAAAAAICEPCDADVEAAVLRMALELDGEPLSPVSCYKLQPERVALYAAEFAPGLTVANAVAVTCTDERGATVETIINTETMTHVIYEDPIMFSELSLPSLVEASFEEGGAWTVGSGSVESLDMEKKCNFALYSTNVSKLEPDCLATLRQYLQKGPVTRLYSGGVDAEGRLHCGFTLRMPPGEVGDWSGINGETVALEHFLA